MDLRRMRIVTAAIIGGLPVVMLVGYPIWRQHREESRSQQLLMVEIAVGETANQVKQRLASPDLDSPTSSGAKYPGPCSKASGVRVWRYFTGPDGGAYAFVFFDAADRVTCVEKGLIAI